MPVGNKLNLSKKSVAFVLEFLVVVLGVLVAFWLSSWREEQKNEQLERFYLEELVQSLSLDQQQLRAVIEEQGHRRTLLDTLLQILPHAQYADKPHIDSLFAATRGNRTFFPAVGAYKAMVAEGSLHLISNKELVTSLVELYEYYYVRAIYLGTVLDKEVDRSNWERRDFFSLYDNEFYNLSAIRSKELRAIEAHRHAYIGVYLGHARKTLQKIEGVRAALKKELVRLE